MEPKLMNSDGRESLQVTAIPAEETDSELKLVHVIFRHGDRTPDHPYPNDPHKSHTYAPYGYGQLTKAGYKRMYNNGKFFRERYGAFLGPLYKQNEIHAQSTETPRTRMSLQLFCAGLFPPVKTDLEWHNDLNWQPCDFTSVPSTEDSLMLPIVKLMTSPKFQTEVVGNYAPVLERNKELFEVLAGFVGRPCRTPLDVIGINALLKAQEEYGLELPAWTKPYYPEKLRELSCEAWGYFVHNDALKEMLGGSLLEKLAQDWEAKIENKLHKKLFLYSAHDTTIVSVLGACNVWNNSKLPEYGIAVIFELRQNRKTGEYGVQVYVRNEPENEPVLLTIPGCKSFCPLRDFKEVLSNHFPANTK